MRNYNNKINSDQSLGEINTLIKNVLGRYWRIAVGPALVLFILVLCLSILIPSYYQSDVSIFIQPQRISSRVLTTPERTEMRERLESVVQEVLSRPRLRSVIEKHNLYNELRGPAGIEQALLKFRGAIDLTPIQSTTGGDLAQTFKLTFTHQDSDTSYKVTQSLSNLFIEESQINLRSELQGTEEFLDSQLEGARKKLEETEAEVQTFVQKNFGKLPDHLNAAIARLQNLQAQLATNSQVMTANVTRRSNLQAELAELQKSGVGMGGTIDANAAVDPEETLAQLENALSVFQARYSPQHPDIVNTKKRIEALKKLIRDGGGQLPTSGKRTPNYSASEPIRNVRRQLGEVDVQLTALRLENETLKSEIQKLQNDIREMPLQEQELLKIKRDYGNVKAEYEKLMAARNAAGLESSLVRSAKNAQFRIIEPAEKPIMPAGPNRLVIVVVGIILSLGIFVAVPFGLYLLNMAFKTVDEVEDQLGVNVIGVIPPMITPESLLFKQRLVSSAMLASVVSLVAGMTIIFITV